jgi:hypothetical protein
MVGSGRYDWNLNGDGRGAAVTGAAKGRRLQATGVGIRDEGVQGFMGARVQRD